MDNIINSIFKEDYEQILNSVIIKIFEKIPIFEYYETKEDIESKNVKFILDDEVITPKSLLTISEIYQKIKNINTKNILVEVETLSCPKLNFEISAENLTIPKDVILNSLKYYLKDNQSFRFCNFKLNYQVNMIFIKHFFNNNKMIIFVNCTKNDISKISKKDLLNYLYKDISFKNSHL